MRGTTEENARLLNPLNKVLLSKRINNSKYIYIYKIYLHDEYKNVL